MNWRTGFSLFSLCLLLLGGFSSNVFAIAAADGTLIWHTYQGGSNYFDDEDPGDEPSVHSGIYSDHARGVAHDSAGNLYVVGYGSGPWETPIDALNPVNPHTPVQTWNGSLSNDVFVAKFNPDGELIWHTFLGAAPINYGGVLCNWFGEDRGLGIAVDPSDAVLITGWSNQPWGPGAASFGPEMCRTEQAFVAKLNSADGTLDWNTFLGSNGYQYWNQGYDVATDASGNVYVTGQTGAPVPWPAPDTARPYEPFRGSDAWVAKLDPAGNLLWNSFFGTSNGDTGESIALDASGNIYVTGNSALSFTDGTFLPNPGDPPMSPVEAAEGGNDAYLVKLDSSGLLQWYTFLGGAEGHTTIEPGYGVDVDNAGHVFVTGRSYASWGGTDTVLPYTGGEMAFVAKVNAGTGALMANTFMHRYGRDIDVNADGHVFVTGMSIGGGADAFVCELDNDLNRQWCTNLFRPWPPELYQYCGGGDYGHGIVVSDDGYVYMAGQSQYECIPDHFTLTPVSHHADYDESTGKMGLSTGDDMLLAKIKTGGGDIWGVSLNGHNAGDPGPSSLYRIDRATGAGTLVGTNLGYAVNSIAIDPTTGVMYAATTSWSGEFNGLLYVNTTTGTAAEIGAFGESVHTIVGLTFDSSGQLFGWHEWWGDDLVQIDKTTGAVTMLGDSGINSFSQVLAFDSSDTLFMIQADDPPPDGNEWVYTINPSTGLGTLSHGLDFDPGSGGAAFDPATGLLWAAEGHQSGKIYDSVIRVSNIWANTYTDIDTDIEFLNAITISDAPYTEEVANTAPVANDDDYLGLINTPLVIPAPGVLGNDYDLDGDAIKVKQLTAPLHGGIVMFADGSFTYTPDPEYCGPDSLTYIVTDDPPAIPPALDSEPGTVSITVTCGDNPPVAMDDSFATAEDTELVVLAPGVLGNDYDLDGDPLSVKSYDGASHGAVTMEADGSFTYDPSDDYCGPDSFTYVVMDSPPFHPPQDSAPATVNVWVDCVNDPPVVTSVTPGAGIVDYSDHITQVTVTIEDIDSVGPDQVGIRWSPGWGVVPANLPQPYMNSTEVCVVVPNESILDGSICTYTLDGQIVEPGDRTYTIGFKGRDQHGNGPECTESNYVDVSVCQHVLTVEPEDATVMLDSNNSVAVEVAEEGGSSDEFSLFFSAWETNDPDFSHGDAVDPGDLNNMVPFMTLAPVGPGTPVEGACGFMAPTDPLLGYAQVAMFECSFDEVPVNTYEVIARVDGIDDENRYYVGADEDVFTVFDPSLGFTTGGGYFYWPGTKVPEDACLEYECAEFDTTECLVFNYDVCLVPDPCAGYIGDKTNFGFNFKYNKKKRNVQGSLLMMRHTTDEICFGLDLNWKVKSNAIEGMGLGTEDDADGPYGWAAVNGKATFRDPDEVNTGGNTFLLYVEDHGEQGCDQDPVDQIWIEVDAENIWLDPMGPDPAAEDPADDGDDVPIFCGNIIVPHETGDKGGGKGGGKPPKD